LQMLLAEINHRREMTRSADPARLAMLHVHAVATCLNPALA